VELSLFGSALRDDFGPHSDIDLLVRFAPRATFTTKQAPVRLDRIDRPEMREHRGKPGRHT